MTTEQFDLAAARAELKHGIGDVHDKGMSARRIAKAALDELDRRDKKAAEQRATDEAAFRHWADHRTWPSPWSVPSLMADTWMERGRLAALAEGALRVEIKTLKAQHALDAEVVCAVHREYEALENKLRETDLAVQQSQHAEREVKAQLAETEKSRKAMFLLDDERLETERLRTTIEFGNDLVAAMRVEIEALRARNTKQCTTIKELASQVRYLESGWGDLKAELARVNTCVPCRIRPATIRPEFTIEMDTRHDD